MQRDASSSAKPIKVERKAHGDQLSRQHSSEVLSCAFEAAAGSTADVRELVASGCSSLVVGTGISEGAVPLGVGSGVGVRVGARVEPP